MGGEMADLSGGRSSLTDRVLGGHRSPVVPVTAVVRDGEPAALVDVRAELGRLVHGVRVPLAAPPRDGRIPDLALVWGEESGDRRGEKPESDGGQRRRATECRLECSSGNPLC